MSANTNVTKQGGLGPCHFVRFSPQWPLRRQRSAWHRLRLRLHPSHLRAVQRPRPSRNAQQARIQKAPAASKSPTRTRWGQWPSAAMARTRTAKITAAPARATTAWPNGVHAILPRANPTLGSPTASSFHRFTPAGHEAHSAPESADSPLRRGTRRLPGSDRSRHLKEEPAQSRPPKMRILQMVAMSGCLKSVAGDRLADARTADTRRNIPRRSGFRGEGQISSTCRTGRLPHIPKTYFARDVARRVGPLTRGRDSNLPPLPAEYSWGPSELGDGARIYSVPT
jgi:hypothetical protein